MSLAYPVREQILAATKQAKLTPRPAPGEGAEAFTVRRLHEIRTMFLAATPFAIAGEIPARQTTDVLLPPFTQTWLEWSEGYYRVGAHVGGSSAGTLVTFVVISGRRINNFYDAPDRIHIDDAGRFTRRADVSAKRWSEKQAHEQRAYEKAYDILAYLHQPRADADEVRPGRYRVQIPPEPRNEITTVLVDANPSTSTSRPTPPPESVRPLHNVRGHIRRYKSGGQSWVQPHTRGDAANGTRITTYEVKGHPADEAP